MDSTTLLIAAFGGLALLGFVAVFGAARASDRRNAVGYLSRETRKRDKATPVEVDEPVSGKQVERAAALERVGGSSVATVTTATAPVPWTAPDPDVVGVTRRQFMNRGIVVGFGLGIAGFGGSLLAFVWPSLTGGFGSKVRAGKLEDILSTIEKTKAPAYFPDARSYVVGYPKDALSKAEKVYEADIVTGMEAGIVALYQKCVHLGCRVPWCQTSQWFECPCHGSQYNRVGERKGGPAPRGLDRFPMTISGGQVVIDTKKASLGPPIGTDTTGQTAEGPHCISAAGGH